MAVFRLLRSIAHFIDPRSKHRSGVVLGSTLRVAQFATHANASAAPHPPSIAASARNQETGCVARTGPLFVSDELAASGGVPGTLPFYLVAK